MTNLRKWKKLTCVPRFSTVKPNSYGDKTQMLIFAKRAFPSFPRDRWRNCWLISSNSIGSECCLKFVIIISQPMVRVTIMHDWVTTFIVVHDKLLRFTCPSCTESQNGLARKTSVKPLQKIFTLVLNEVGIEISTALRSFCICICK